MTDFAPPQGPPAFLSSSELDCLAEQGHLTISLPQTLQHDLDTFFAAANDFFDLPTETKQKLYPGPEDNFELGYHNVAPEKQYISFRHASVHEQTPEVENLIGPLWYDIAHLLYRILVDIGHYLDFDNAVWLPLVWRSLRIPPSPNDMPLTLLRVFRYEPESGVADAHADVGLLTLCTGKAKGLQVWNRPKKGHVPTGAEEIAAADPANATEKDTPSSGIEPNAYCWRDAGEFTLLVGDTLSILSARRFRSGRHRVVGNPLGRGSIVFALRPDVETTVDLQAFGGAGQLYMKDFWRRIRRGRVNVNSPKETREALYARNRLNADKEKPSSQAAVPDGAVHDAEHEKDSNEVEG